MASLRRTFGGTRSRSLRAFSPESDRRAIAAISAMPLLWPWKMGSPASATFRWESCGNREFGPAPNRCGAAGARAPKKTWRATLRRRPNFCGRRRVRGQRWKRERSFAGGTPASGRSFPRQRTAPEQLRLRAASTHRNLGADEALPSRFFSALALLLRHICWRQASIRYLHRFPRKASLLSRH